jgi:hypothetical protein
MVQRIMVLGVAGLLASTGMARAEDSLDLQQVAQADTGRFVVLFALDQATLDSEALAVVAAAAAEFRRTGSARISVRGHTDTSGSSAYNQALSERRERAVARELVNQGVPAGAITSEALGETDLAVPTPDGVVEAANRRVEIMVEPPLPAPVAAAPAPAPEPAPTPAPAPLPMQRDRIFSLGAFYGFNFEDEVGNTSHLGGLNLAVDVPVAPWLSLGAEQAGFYHFDTPNDGFGGRTVASVDLILSDDDDFRPHIGGNIGYLYGSGIDDDFVGGPEIGFASGPFIAKVAYDIPFNRGADEGIVNATIGIRF